MLDAPPLGVLWRYSTSSEKRGSRMVEVRGFLKYKRREPAHRPVEQRIHDFTEFDLPLTPDEIHRQAARCMDCGIPFCHGMGCPLRNSIPDINELVYKNRWRQACQLLHSTNNFPEITGRICPAPCETACTLAINDQPVTIRYIEQAIVERGFEQGWIKPLPAKEKSGKRIAVVGSGPAGLAAAQQLMIFSGGTPTSWRHFAIRYSGF